MKGLFLAFVFVGMLKGTHAILWRSTIQDGDIFYVCNGATVTIPWQYNLSPGDIIFDVQWLFDGRSDEIMALFTHGSFNPLPAFSGRIQMTNNAGIELGHMTMGDSGNVTVEVNGMTGSGLSMGLNQTVQIKVLDRLMTSDGSLHVQQAAEAVLDRASDQWTIQLQCGTFTSDQPPPFNVEWLTPDGRILNSSDYSNGNFNLNLSPPIAGGSYTCRIPTQQIAKACVQGNGHGEATVVVDKIESRLTLLEKENQQLKEQMRNVQGCSSQSISFHAQYLENDHPPAGSPLVVLQVHTNQGGAYNNTTGYFTAPVPGTYFFIASSGSYDPNVYTMFDLYADDTLIDRGEAYDHDNYDTFSTVHGVVTLQDGQRVWIQSHGGRYQSFFTAFSGFLLSK